MNATVLDLIVSLLPDDGSRRPLGEIIYRAREDLGVPRSAVQPAIMDLCTNRRVALETVGGWQFLRRVVVVVDFPLRARPHFPAPRLVRRPRLQGPAAPAARRQRVSTAGRRAA